MNEILTTRLVVAVSDLVKQPLGRPGVSRLSRGGGCNLLFFASRVVIALALRLMIFSFRSLGVSNKGVMTSRFYIVLFSAKQTATIKLTNRTRHKLICVFWCQFYFLLFFFFFPIFNSVFSLILHL